MTAAEINEILDRLAPGYAPSETLLRKVEEDARSGAESLVAIWAENDSGLAGDAAAILQRVEQSVIGPLADWSARLPDGRAVEALRFAVEAQIRMEAVLRERLERALQDKRLFQPPKSKADEPQPARRVCDEAYVLLRAMRYLKESSATALVTQKEFLNYPEELKEQQIARARMKQPWTDLLEEVEDDPEAA
ncbi:MAG: hypothetical protein K2X35_17430 [Bryobacteraceae bacterium]|nr:hypothetical protein [Bryobacteraceae bacterium]